MARILVDIVWIVGMAAASMVYSDPVDDLFAVMGGVWVVFLMLDAHRYVMGE